MDMFQQSGQLDYVALSNSVISNSMMVVQRLSAADINDITYHAGMELATSFRLSEMGQIHIADALRNLHAYPGFECVLWFGFGYKSFLALLTEQQSGFNCAALCASLAEAYGIDGSA